jgi:hypothetical protein
MSPKSRVISADTPYFTVVAIVLCFLCLFFLDGLDVIVLSESGSPTGFTSRGLPDLPDIIFVFP